MLFYIICIFGGDAAIITLSLLAGKEELSSYSNTYLILAGLLLIAACLLVDGVSAFLIRRLPEKWFTYKVNFHKVGKKECKFYEKAGIKLWKDHIIELGMFTAFSKKHVSNPDSPEYIERFILESNYGVWIHFTGIFIGLAIIPFYPEDLLLWMSLPAAVINGIMNLFPMMILRYNLPRLERMRVLAEKKALRVQKN